MSDRLMPEEVKGDPNAEHIFRQVTLGERYKRILITVATLLSALAVGILLVVLQQISETTNEIRKTQTTGSPVLLKLQEIAETIESCVNPEGQCYKDSQERQAEVVGNLNEIILLTVTCIDQPGSQTLKETETCVKTQYKEDNEND